MATRAPLIIRTEADQDRAIAAIQALPPGAWEVTITRHRKRRSVSQNALLWKWYGELQEAVADASGASPEDIHEYCKTRFLAPRPVTIGDSVTLVRSTKRMTVAEFGAYLDRVYAWATGDLGLVLTNPEELRHGPMQK